MGVLIFEGMQVGIDKGDFTVEVNEKGQIKSKLILSTSYNVLPIWIQIANNNIKLSYKAHCDIKEQWNENVENRKFLLQSELTTSMQVFVACGIALDALYAQLKPFANISQTDQEGWRKNRTNRAAQIAEIIRRVYKLKNPIFDAFKKNIKSIIEFRDEAVHPTHTVKQTCTRPDIPIGVDWRFSAYRYENAAICYRRTMEMLIHLYEKKTDIASVNENMENIFKTLKEFNLISENTEE